MTKRKKIKAEVDNVGDGFLDALLRMVTSLEKPDEEGTADEWKQFVESTYGSCAGAPIERGSRGDFESRLSLR